MERLTLSEYSVHLAQQQALVIDKQQRLETNVRTNQYNATLISSARNTLMTTLNNSCPIKCTFERGELTNTVRFKDSYVTMYGEILPGHEDELVVAVGVKPTFKKDNIPNLVEKILKFRKEYGINVVVSSPLVAKTIIDYILNNESILNEWNQPITLSEEMKKLIASIKESAKTDGPSQSHLKVVKA